MASPPPRRLSMSALKSKILQPSLTSHYEVYIQAPTEVNSYITLTNAGPGLDVGGNKREDRLQRTMH